MTIKEYNTIRKAAYDAATQIAEIAEQLKSSNVYLYELTEGTRHEILALNSRTQLNDNTIVAHGFNPEKVNCNYLMLLNRKTTCAEFN